MFRNLEAWLGRGPENCLVKRVEEPAADEKVGNRDINKPSDGAGGEPITSVQEDPLLQQAKGLSGKFLESFAFKTF